MWDVLVAARGLSELVREPLKDVKKDQKKERDRVSDYLSASAIHSLEDAQKRELSARERSGMMEVFAVTESVLRDALLIADGCAEDAVNAIFPGFRSALPMPAPLPSWQDLPQSARHARALPIMSHPS
jgi:hypothetical protein